MVSKFTDKSDEAQALNPERQRQAISQTVRQTSNEPLVKAMSTDIGIDLHTKDSSSGISTGISPELAETASQLRLVITRTARKLRQEAGGDLTPTSMVALASIDRLAPLTPTELAVAEDVSRPTVTRIINNLLEKGLIRRDSDPRDGRSCLLSPTDAGIAYLAERRFRKSAYMAEMLGTLEQDEIETLSRAAGILDAALLNRARASRVQQGEDAGVSP